MGVANVCHVAFDRQAVTAVWIPILAWIERQRDRVTRGIVHDRHDFHAVLVRQVAETVMIRLFRVIAGHIHALTEIDGDRIPAE